MNVKRHHVASFLLVLLLLFLCVGLFHFVLLAVLVILFTNMTERIVFSTAKKKQQTSATNGMYGTNNEMAKSVPNNKYPVNFGFCGSTIYIYIYRYTYAIKCQLSVTGRTKRSAENVKEKLS